MSTLKNRGLTMLEVDRIMEWWHDAMRDAKVVNYSGKATEDSLVNEELYILQTQIVPHAFRFENGAAPNELWDFVEEEQGTADILWNYVEFAGQVFARAIGLGVTVSKLFANAVIVLRGRKDGARAEFLETLFGRQFVMENIGDKRRIYEFSRRHRINPTPELKEEQTPALEKSE